MSDSSSRTEPESPPQKLTMYNLMRWNLLELERVIGEQQRQMNELVEEAAQTLVEEMYLERSQWRSGDNCGGVDNEEGVEVPASSYRNAAPEVQKPKSKPDNNKRRSRNHRRNTKTKNSLKAASASRNPVSKNTRNTSHHPRVSRCFDYKF